MRTIAIAATPRLLVLSARMAAWIVAVSILARVTSLPRVQRIVSCRLRSRAGVPVDRGETSALRTEAQRTEACRGAPGQDGRSAAASRSADVPACCWKRALVLHRFLSLRDIESRVTFRCWKDADGTMRGHAWLEHEGRPLLEDDAARCVVTFSLPACPGP